jgi:multiple sugar transport system permease protein
MSTASVPLGVVARRQRSYYRFIMPALVVIGAVIIFPWLFTIWMSTFDWKIGTEAHFVGIANYTALASNQRFLEAVGAHVLFHRAGGRGAADPGHDRLR